MNAKTLLTAARRILIEKEWVQGSYAQTTNPDGSKNHYRLLGGRLVPSNQYDEPTIDADGKVIQTSQIGAVCAIGAMELALANKDYDGDMSGNVTDPAVEDARRLLERGILEREDGAPVNAYVEERYAEYLYDEFNYREGYDKSANDDDLKAWAKDQEDLLSVYEFAAESLGDDFDGVEEWNDREGRTKREVIEAFDRAIALA